MKKKNLIILVLIVVLGALALYLGKTRSAGTLAVTPDYFAFKDTASITKMFIAEKTGKQITLELKDGIWYANNIKAKPALVKLVKTTLYNIQITAPVADAALENVMKQFAIGSKKVELYSGKNKVRTYYIGGTTQDELGTYIMRADNNEPYVTHIPGFVGYYSVRFFTNIEDWRDLVIFQSAPENIASIEVKYPKNNQESFKLEVIDDNYITLFNAAGDTAFENVNGEFLRNTVTNFKSIAFSRYQKPFTPEEMFYVFNPGPIAALKVADRYGEKLKVVLYRKSELDPDMKMEISEAGTIMEDVDGFYAIINDKDTAVVQSFVFDKLLVKYSEFFVGDESKK
ncbi:MAG: hypothetical protein ACJAZ3_000013 [Sphingobacteriales bacterium]|jgi:hypothetical protein